VHGGPPAPGRGQIRKSGCEFWRPAPGDWELSESTAKDWWLAVARAESAPAFAMGGSPAWDGTLSLGSFNTSAAALVKRWKDIEVDDSLPEWTWKPCSKSGVPSEVCIFFRIVFLSPFSDSPCFLIGGTVEYACLSCR
jgi:hypothetical protein